MNYYNNLPVWLRWSLFVPLALIGGFLAGYLIYLINVSQAVKSDAPIAYIAEFAAGFFASYVCYYLVYELAPSYKTRALIVILTIGLIGCIADSYTTIVIQEYRDFISGAGSLLAIFKAWKDFIYISKQKQ